MTDLSPQQAIDLQWLDRPGLIAAWRVGDLLVDCGPRTCLDRLLDAIGDWRPRALLLTHIHFDHAGAAGALTRRWPDLEVWVHRRGARHMTDPARLEASARRVFGDDFDRRFGHLDPVPEANLHAIDGGETVHGLRSAATPGHASHHVAYLDEASGRAFTGDVAGVRLLPGGPVLPPTPPPDIDVPLWLESVDTVAAWRPASLGLPHFGVVDDPPAHLDALRTSLRHHAELAATGDAAAYVAAFDAELDATAPAELHDDYRLVLPPEQNHVGLRRWIDQAKDA